MPIVHTQLNVFQFTEAVKNTTPYLKEKAGGLRNLMTSKKNVERMYNYYGQAHRHIDGVKYLKQNPNISQRDVKIIEEILSL